MITRFINKVLECIWNMTAHIHSPVNYYLFSQGENKIVVRDMVIKGEMKKLIFVSHQLLYLRAGRLKKKKVRLYRVEVIENSSDDSDALSPSKIYMVPELCNKIFKNTLIPHSCAINFVISKITLEQ